MYYLTCIAMASLLWVVIFCKVILQAVWGHDLQETGIGNNYGIYGGYDVSIEDNPFMVGIYGSTFLIWFYRFHCGGSIIHEKFVLTAAHCVVGYYSIKVGVGSDQIDQGDFLAVDLRITRNDYDKVQLLNDISLVKLVKPLQFGPKVAAIRLPVEGYELEQGTPVTVTGWGRTESGTTDTSTTLRQVTVPILPEWKCRTVHEVCAGSQGFGTCNGDSGSPLVYNNTVIGVVSHRRQKTCAGPYGTVYIRVASYTTWIKKNLE